MKYCTSKSAVPSPLVSISQRANVLSLAHRSSWVGSLGWSTCTTKVMWSGS
jgi:hypothetical protein